MRGCSGVQGGSNTGVGPVSQIRVQDEYCLDVRDGKDAGKSCVEYIYFGLGAGI